MKSVRKTKISGLSEWARRMEKIGAWKARERKTWLRKSTVTERIRMLEALLMSNEPLRGKTIPEPRFISLSLALEKARASKRRS